MSGPYSERNTFTIPKKCNYCGGTGVFSEKDIHLSIEPFHHGKGHNRRLARNRYGSCLSCKRLLQFDFNDIPILVATRIRSNNSLIGFCRGGGCNRSFYDKETVPCESFYIWNYLCPCFNCTERLREYSCVCGYVTPLFAVDFPSSRLDQLELMDRLDRLESEE